MVHLEILGVTKYVNESFQLEIGELRLNKGGITGLVGENGAGKTTLMKSICGLVNIDSGEISYKGCSVHTHLEELLKQIGSTFISVEGLGDKRLEDLYEEQVFYYQIKNPMSIQEMFALVHLKVAPNIVVKKLSLGMKQRFLLGLTLLHQPEILLLDEPFNGVDPRGVELFKKILTNLAKDKIILISSHNLKDLEDMVSDVVLLKDGKILKRESIDQIRTSYARGLTDYFIQEGEKDVAIET